jgi:DNA-binding response OmpR family regulator
MSSTVLEHKRTVGAGASLDRPPPARPRLVVVEDDTDILEMLTLAFTDAGYTVLPWTQGADAHPFICTAQPDLVILDLWLEHPQAGSMVLGLLMTDPATQQIPVIISSAYRHLLDAEAAHLRAQGYVIVDKPYRIEELLAAVWTLLGSEHARMVGG